MRFSLKSDHWPFAWIGLMLCVVPLVPVHMYDAGRHALRSGVFEYGALGLVLLFPMTGWGALRKSAAFIILSVLAFWDVISAVSAPAHELALQGVLLAGAGILIVAAIGAGARERERYTRILDGLAVAELAVSFSGFLTFGRDGRTTMQGLYCDHMLFGAALLLPLPILLAASRAPVSVGRRLLYQMGLVSGTIALGLSLTRSAWVGAVVGIVTYAALRGWCGAGQSRRISPSQMVSLAGIAILVAAALFAAPQSRDVRTRLQTLSTHAGTDANVAWRLEAWRGAQAMISQKPWRGWGLGGYPRWQWAFTPTGHDASVNPYSLTVFDQAHNSYLQAAVETGIPGVLLWIGVLTAAFGQGCRTLRKWTPGGLRQQALCGCLASLAAQATDSFANPAWQYGEVALFLWTTLGLTIALTLPVPDAPGMSVARTVPWWRWAVRVAAAVGIILLLMRVITRTLPFLPAPWL